MLANVRAFRAGVPAAAAGGPSNAAKVQWRLAIVLVANAVLIAGSFSIEDALAPWRMRMDATTPGWCFGLGGASVVGLVMALAVEGGPLAVAESLLAGTLLGYAYFLVGAVQIDMGRALQHAHLVFRGVELGLVCTAAMTLGIAMRLMFRQRLRLGVAPARRAGAQYQLGELMFVVVVFSVGLGLLNLFFDHFHRETQLADILLAAIRSFPAALPWLWVVTRPKVTLAELTIIAAASMGVMVVKAAILYATTGDDIDGVLLLAGERAAAYATSAIVNGLLLRGLGFRWHAV